jgi:hypothetical protein
LVLLVAAIARAILRVAGLRWYDGKRLDDVSEGKIAESPTSTSA